MEFERRKQIKTNRFLIYIGVAAFLVVTLVACGEDEVYENDTEDRASLELLVIDGEMSPVEGAYLSLSGDEFSDHEFSDEDGRFRFTDLDAGEYTAEAEFDGHYEHVSETVMVEEEDSAEVTLQFLCLGQDVGGDC